MILLLGHGTGVAQEKSLIKGFSGGMMIHSGYQTGCDNPYGYNMQGATFGIGGVARLHLTDHFRTGFEGYVSTLGLRNNIARAATTRYFGLVYLPIGTGSAASSTPMLVSQLVAVWRPHT